MGYQKRTSGGEVKAPTGVNALFNKSVTILTRKGPRVAIQETAVKQNICEMEGAAQSRSPNKTRRKSVADILRAAYGAHGRDTLTRRAVKKVLR
jgi:hypothetical protein